MALQILLDMDGVLADFHSAAIRAHNRQENHNDIVTWDFWKDQWGMTDREFWSKCSGYTFWREIDPYPWAKELYESLRELGEVTISTSPSESRNCIPAKLDWLEYHLGVKSSDVMCGGKKWLMADYSNLLIDDSQSNVTKFLDCGGSALIFPQPWNGSVPINREESIQFFLRVCKDAANDFNHGASQCSA